MSQIFNNKMRRLMNTAWRLKKELDADISLTMKDAWKVTRLKDKMSQGIVEFVFQKMNGEVRIAHGTIKSDLIPAGTKPSKVNRTKSPSYICYYDTDKNAWRCFHAHKLLKF